MTVVLSAEAGNFCTGADDTLDPSSFRPDPASALATLRPPIIVIVDGQCYDEGLEIVLAADIRLATTKSSFRLGQPTLGRLPCWGGTQRLPRAIRSGPATTMTLTGESLVGERAMDLGLIHSVHKDRAQAEKEKDRLVDLLLQRGPLALELAKEAVHRGSELSLRDGLRLEGDLNHLLAATDDRAEGLRAFFDKRPPDFTGR